MVLLITGYANGTQLASPSTRTGFPSGTISTSTSSPRAVISTCPGFASDEYGYPVYGNVVYIPEYPEYDVRIIMESGKKGPKSAPDTIGLQVTDTCTGFAPNDPASLRFPKMTKVTGYTPGSSACPPETTA